MASSLRTLARFAFAGRSYHTNQTSTVTLFAKISPLYGSTSVVPTLDGWVQDGNEVRVGELKRIICNLRRRRRYTHALEVSEWMQKTGACVFSTTEHARQLDLIGQVHGYHSAESYFDQLKEEEKNNKTYGALLNCYVRQQEVGKALSLFQKMKEMGLATSPLAYNDIMCLYAKVGQHDKVPQVLEEMKENKVLPDNFSYRICINSYSARGDIEGVENTLKEMESQSHIVMDWNTYAVAAHCYVKGDLTDKAVDALKKSEERLKGKDDGSCFLISLYASLGNKEEVLRLWNQRGKSFNRDYLLMLQSLVKMGEVEEAEEVLKQWESSGNSYDFRVPFCVITAYIDKGMCEKANALLEDLMERGKVTTPKHWSHVASQYLDMGEIEKAVKCMKAALSACMDGGWKPNPDVITRLLNWLGDNGTVEEVEAFVGSLKPAIPVNREMYHALMKAHIRGGKEVDGLLSQMKSDEIEEDEETQKILGTWQEEATAE